MKTEVLVVSAMDDLIKELKVMFPAREFIITGSFALAKYCMLPMETVKDIDVILMDPTQEALDLAKRMQEEFPAGTSASTEGDLIAIFSKSGYKIDIFKGRDEPSIEISGINYATIPHIISAKKRINRMKDWLQLRKMARMFFIQKEFETFLNNQTL